MADLRDALKRSGLVDDKKAKRAAHEETARKKKLGREGVDEEKKGRREAQARREEAQREADRKRAAEQRAQEEVRAERARLTQLLTDHALSEGISGPRRFHFVTRDKRIPHLDLSESTARALTNGELAICDVPGTAGETFVLVTADVARRARAFDRACVLFLNEERA
jgi:hypothetical protein